ncbi:hypothetical protein BDW02DRAFT_243135 [Decorospora gaudefroyi]|uniref:Uncharacterized protein n=1 Tax=Decorospora gaudefroyi TaxID=184978 RepID=A0A6A5JWW8_9PLEO|nr:hypothetical protein BDW02DRAFT_243135 [Decorospora gaudefroyi]
MVHKYAKNKLRRPGDKEERRRELAQITRQTRVFEAFARLTKGRNPQQFMYGHYRNLVGDHIKVVPGGDGLTYEEVPFEKQVLPPGTLWLPMMPRGEVGKPFVWQCEPGFDAEFEWVGELYVGFNNLGAVYNPATYTTCKATQLKQVILRQDEQNFVYYEPVEGGYDDAREHFLEEVELGLWQCYQFPAGCHPCWQPGEEQ